MNVKKSNENDQYFVTDYNGGICVNQYIGDDENLVLPGSKGTLGNIKYSSWQKAENGLRTAYNGVKKLLVRLRVIEY